LEIIQAQNKQNKTNFVVDRLCFVDEKKWAILERAHSEQLPTSSRSFKSQLFNNKTLISPNKTHN